MNSYDIIREAVMAYWEEQGGFAEDVIVFFEQKYEYEDEWYSEAELVECHSPNPEDGLTFHNDFCEGQTCVRNIRIVTLEDIIYFYKEEHRNV